MKIEVCDNMVIVDGQPHVLVSNNMGQDRIRQVIEVGEKMVEAAPTPPPPPPPPPPPTPEPEPEPAPDVVEEDDSEEGDGS